MHFLNAFFVHFITAIDRDKRIAEITRSDLQDYLLEFAKQGKMRTAEKLHLTLRCIFDMAAEDLEFSSPMKKVVIPNYESKKGSALNYEKEQKLINHCLTHLERDTSHALMLLIYTGLRRSELKTLKVIDKTWLKVITSKQKMGKIEELRRIPFTPMLKRILPYIDFEAAKRVNVNSLHTALKRLFPEHHTHELRYTYITRCKECGVNPEIVMLWDGHCQEEGVKSSVVDRGYTDYSDEYQLKQAELVDYQAWQLPTID